MKIEALILIFLAAALSGCSSGPGNSEIKQAFMQQFGGAPNDLSCSVDTDATSKLRNGHGDKSTTSAVATLLESKPEQTWVMNCSGAGQTTQLIFGRDTSGKLHAMPAMAF